MEGFEKVSEFLYSPCPSNFSGGTGITGGDTITVIPDQPYVLLEQTYRTVHVLVQFTYITYVVKSASIVPVDQKRSIFRAVLNSKLKAICSAKTQQKINAIGILY
jgi:hypothetical protein